MELRQNMIWLPVGYRIDWPGFARDVERDIGKVKTEEKEGRGKGKRCLKKDFLSSVTIQIWVFPLKNANACASDTQHHKSQNSTKRKSKTKNQTRTYRSTSGLQPSNLKLPIDSFFHFSEHTFISFPSSSSS